MSKSSEEIVERVIYNACQGNARRVLCVCEQGILRSPTAAKELTAVFGYNTRAVGFSENSLTPVTDRHILWADEIVTFDWSTAYAMASEVRMYDARANVFNLEIPDVFDYDDSELRNAILHNYTNFESEK